MGNRKQFGARLRTIRKANNWSQGKLAEETDLSVEAISNLERGLNHPSYTTLEKLSAALGAPIKSFFEYGELNDDRTELLTKLELRARRLKKTDLEIAIQLIDRLDQQ